MTNASLSANTSFTRFSIKIENQNRISWTHAVSETKRELISILIPFENQHMIGDNRLYLYNFENNYCPDFHLNPIYDNIIQKDANIDNFIKRII